MAQTLKKTQPRKAMATAHAMTDMVTGEYCENCNTDKDVTQYCGECGLAVCPSCYNDEGHDAHDD